MSIRWAAFRGGIAALVGAALLAHAALSSRMPPPDWNASVVAAIAAHALCVGAAQPSSDPGVPPPIPDRRHQGCCILCTAPALTALAAPPDLVAPAWGHPLAAPLRRLPAPDFVSHTELSPVRARAPPRA